LAVDEHWACAGATVVWQALVGSLPLPAAQRPSHQRRAAHRKRPRELVKSLTTAAFPPVRCMALLGGCSTPRAASKEPVRLLGRSRPTQGMQAITNGLFLCGNL